MPCIPRFVGEILCQGPASCQPVGGEAIRPVGSCQPSLFSPVAVWEALTLVSSGWYNFQLQGEMLNIKPVLIGSGTASKKETSDCARLNFTLYHSPPFISLPPRSLHKQTSSPRFLPMRQHSWGRNDFVNKVSLHFPGPAVPSNPGTWQL